MGEAVINRAECCRLVVDTRHSFFLCFQELGGVVAWREAGA